VTTETIANEPIGSLPVPRTSSLAPVQNPPQQTSLPNTAPLPSEASDVEFSTSGLITGKNLSFPIYDKSGLLLVAQGAVVTSRFKELLVLRGMHKVMVSNTDAKAMCGLLHDWGMTYVPEQLRHAKRVLTRIEFLEIQKHPIYTANMLQRIWGLPPQVAMICYQVHECPSGTGYPRRRKGNSIHPCAAILKVADAYIALTSPRPTRPPLSPAAAIECLVHMAARKVVDNATARALLKVLSQFPIGSLVQLSDGSKAQVLRRNGDNYHMPIVQVLEKAKGTQADPRDESCIIDPSKSKVKIVRVLPTPGRRELEFNPDMLVVKRS
jgi:hypothetical protein